MTAKCEEIVETALEFGKLCEDDTYDARCAEIFITSKRQLIFHCSLCDLKYGKFMHLLEHLNAEHYVAPDSSQMASQELAVAVTLDENTEANEELEIETAEDCDEYYLMKEHSDAEAVSIDSADQSHHQAETQASNLVKEIIEIEPLYTSADEHLVAPVLSSPHKKRKKLTSSNKRASTPRTKTAHICEICSRSFACESRLLTHSKTHSSERNYKCEFCGFAFKEEFNLRSHLRRHSGQKQFECTTCAKQFYTRNELNTHIRRHTGERPFVCSSCGMGFVSSGSLNDHMKRHTNKRTHQCELCEKSFYDSFQLKEHLAVHTQERNHVCSVCKAKFSRQKSLVVHMKLHANRREYACKICEAAFNQKQALSAHLRNKHNVLRGLTGAEISQQTDDKMCLICDLDFANVPALLAHMQQLHNDQVSLEDSVEIEEEHLDTDEGA